MLISTLAMAAELPSLPHGGSTSDTLCIWMRMPTRERSVLRCGSVSRTRHPVTLPQEPNPWPSVGWRGSDNAMTQPLFPVRASAYVRSSQSRLRQSLHRAVWSSSGQHGDATDTSTHRTASCQIQGMSTT